MKTEALEVLKNRRAIRRYKSEQVSREELEAVLEAGTYAPTGVGTQGVQIIAVHRAEKLETEVLMQQAWVPAGSTGAERCLSLKKASSC